ncbi:Phosphorelay intermediate protein [Entomophthora muscae]|uniref:Phosphorelay intermediate protein n=1 Tax=Entomophthora muscae TaxID=34485 RepID=A0ACC2SQE3_9FUNG|nr:Phosphorelay intermediate protein [Entomophthora muscae]
MMYLVRFSIWTRRGIANFSKSIVFNYFEQAENTFLEMDAALEKGDLPNLSRLGHFLKGSSAALGVKNVKIMCERIQHYGSLKDETGVTPIEEKEAIQKITTCLETAKEEYHTANTYLKDFYDDLEEEDDEETETEREGDLEKYPQATDSGLPLKLAGIEENPTLKDSAKMKESELPRTDAQSIPEPTLSTA